MKRNSIELYMLSLKMLHTLSPICMLGKVADANMTCRNLVGRLWNTTTCSCKFAKSFGQADSHVHECKGLRHIVDADRVLVLKLVQ